MVAVCFLERLASIYQLTQLNMSEERGHQSCCSGLSLNCLVVTIEASQFTEMSVSTVQVFTSRHSVTFRYGRNSNFFNLGETWRNEGRK